MGLLFKLSIAAGMVVATGSTLCSTSGGVVSDDGVEADGDAGSGGEFIVRRRWQNATVASIFQMMR